MIEDLNPGKDTMTIWLSKNYPDTLLFKISQDTVVIDTTELVLFKEKKIKDKEETQEKLPSLKFKTNIKSSKLDLNKKLQIEFSHPLEKYNFDKLVLILKEKDTITPKVEFVDSLKRKLLFKEDFEEGEKYELFFPDSVFTDILGYSNDTTFIHYQIKELQEYGTIKINLSNTESKSNYILQLLNDREKIIKRIYVSEDGIISLDNMNPGAYKLKLILDSNNNDRWDTGDYIKGIEPEKVYYFNKTLDVRTNWDIEEDWKL